MEKYYLTLNLPNNASVDQVKSAYKRLALLYHPDKNKGNSCDEFLKIQEAYTNIITHNEFITSNESSTWGKLNDFFKRFIKNESPMLKQFVKMFYDDEDKFKKDMKNIDLIGIYDTICKKMNNNFENLPNDMSVFDIHIYCVIDVSIEDKYFNKQYQLTINRKTRESCKLSIKLHDNLDDYHIIENEGEFDASSNTFGDIIVYVNVLKHDKYIIINNDVHCKLKIDLYTYLYGGTVTLEYFDEDIEISISEGLLNKGNHVTIDNKGIDGGNLIINFEIENLHSEKMRTQIQALLKD